MSAVCASLWFDGKMPDDAELARLAGQQVACRVVVREAGRTRLQFALDPATRAVVAVPRRASP